MREDKQMFVHRRQSRTIVDSFGKAENEQMLNWISFIFRADFQDPQSLVRNHLTFAREVPASSSK